MKQTATNEYVGMCNVPGWPECKVPTYKGKGVIGRENGCHGCATNFKWHDKACYIPLSHLESKYQLCFHPSSVTAGYAILCDNCVQSRGVGTKVQHMYID